MITNGNLLPWKTALYTGASCTLQAKALACSQRSNQSSSLHGAFAETHGESGGDISKSVREMSSIAALCERKGGCEDPCSQEADQLLGVKQASLKRRASSEGKAMRSQEAAMKMEDK